MNTFQQYLTNHATYDTPPTRASNASWWRTTCFYLNVTSAVLRSSRLAKQGRYTRQHWARSSTDIVQAIERNGGRLHITGLQHLHALKPPVVFIANHMSSLETLVLPVLLLRFTDIAFVVKRSLTTYPVFGHVMRAVEPIVVDRVNARDDLVTVLDEGTTWLERGRSIVIFPQATRSSGIDHTKFNSLGVKLAQRAQVPVVPIALKTDFWGNGRLVKNFGPIDPHKTIHFEFGAPLVAEKNTQEAIFSFISTRLAAWNQCKPTGSPVR